MLEEMLIDELRAKVLELQERIVALERENLELRGHVHRSLPKGRESSLCGVLLIRGHNYLFCVCKMKEGK